MAAATNATVQQASEYFNGCLHTESWDTADDSTKTKALAQAQRQLEPYRNQVNSTRLLYAVCEQALWLLLGDKRGELQQAGVQGFSVGNMSEQFNTKGRDPAIAPQAWAYLRGSGVKVGQLR
jgi:hypothetical protein